MDTDVAYGTRVLPPYGLMPHSMLYSPPYPTLDSMPPPLYPTTMTYPSQSHGSHISPNRIPISTLPPWLALSSGARKKPAAGSGPRKQLTNQDRRMICLYHEKSKAKQTEIGALFGVERSTVSKTLSQKAKYLAVGQGPCPEKQTKSRVPDITSALSNLVKEYQRKKIPINDEILMEKALAFAHACSLTEGSGASDKDWLENFKQENSILFGRDPPYTENPPASRVEQRCNKWGKNQGNEPTYRSSRLARWFADQSP
ncbi:hypothetical protein N7522_006445 [Penicillium canescens]|nr:hypothetical protein N7522_006445 [Penicillium canescens]